MSRLDKLEKCLNLLAHIHMLGIKFNCQASLMAENIDERDYFNRDLEKMNNDVGELRRAIFELGSDDELMKEGLKRMENNLNGEFKVEKVE